MGESGYSREGGLTGEDGWRWRAAIGETATRLDRVTIRERATRSERANRRDRATRRERAARK